MAHRQTQRETPGEGTHSQLPPCTSWPPQNRGHTQDLVSPWNRCSLGYQKTSLASLVPVASVGGGGSRRDAACCVPQHCPPAHEPRKEKTSEVSCDRDASGIFISFSDSCRGLQLHLLI